MTEPRSFFEGESSPAPSAAERALEFRRLLVAMTRRVYVTQALLAINGIVFVLMLAGGAGLKSPTSETLVAWGANFGPKTLGGEWWRLLTSTFVHIGLIHLLFNMAVLGTAGPLVERMIGNVGFLVAYVFAGLCGSLASLLWNPMVVSAGASGAIFGVYGVLLAVLIGRHTLVPPMQLKQLQGSGFGFLAINLASGMFLPNIDVAGHVGGLVGGFLAGLVLRQPLTPAARSGRAVRNVLVETIGVALIVAGAYGVRTIQSGVPELVAEFEQFEPMEKRVLGKYNLAIASAGQGARTDADFADEIEREVLPDWRAARARIQAITPVPKSLEARTKEVIEYLRLRQEGWEMFVRGLREGNLQLMQESNERHKLAEDAVRRLQKLNEK